MKTVTYDETKYVLVPVEPTDAMHAARAMYGDTSDWWNAVIAAAQQPPAEAHPVAWRVPLLESNFGDVVDHGVRDGLVLVMHRGSHGWKVAEAGHAKLPHQTYVKDIAPLCESSYEIVVVGLEGGGWRTVWARSDNDVSHPAPPSAPVGVEGFDKRFAEMLLGILNDVQDELGFTDEDKLCANGSAEIVTEIRELKRAAALTQQPAAVDEAQSEAIRARRQQIAGWLEGLSQAARSLRTIAEQAGRTEGMEDMQDVRGYANSRATVAEAALTRASQPRAKEPGDGCG